MIKFGTNLYFTELTTLGQIKYTERFKKADEYRQAWINNILGGDEPPGKASVYNWIQFFVVVFLGFDAVVVN